MSRQDQSTGSGKVDVPSNRIGIVVIDDDPAMVKKICKVLGGVTGIEVLGTADSCKGGITAIQEHVPQVMFLNVEMPDGSAFDVLDGIGKDDARIIFMTADEEYTLPPYKHAAIDLLHKPFGRKHILKAIGKALEREAAHTMMGAPLMQASQLPKPMEPRIGLQDQHGTRFFDIDRIVRCKAEGNYTEFHFTCGSRMVVSTLIKDFEELLEPYGFSRVHRSHLVNLRHMTRYFSAGSGSLVTSDGAEIAISRNRRPLFLRMLASYGISLKM